MIADEVKIRSEFANKVEKLEKKKKYSRATFQWSNGKV